jgi:hypothetical protein
MSKRSEIDKILSDVLPKPVLADIIWSVASAAGYQGDIQKQVDLCWDLFVDTLRDEFGDGAIHEYVNTTQRVQDVYMKALYSDKLEIGKLLEMREAENNTQH